MEARCPDGLPIRRARYRRLGQEADLGSLAQRDSLHAEGPRMDPRIRQIVVHVERL